LKFTPGQLRDTLGLSVETFRHWKRVLPPFMDRNGHGPCFTTGDLLTGAILWKLTDSYGIRVGHLAGISSRLSELCESAAWAALDDRLLIIDIARCECQFAKAQADLRPSDLVILCPLGSILRDLREALMKSKPTVDQEHLLFLPAEVPPRARRLAG